MLTANERQAGGEHYLNKPIQPWDFIVANNIPFLEGSIIKYLVRWREKGGILDLEKCEHYLQKLLEVAKAEQSCNQSTPATSQSD